MPLRCFKADYDLRASRISNATLAPHTLNQAVDTDGPAP